MKTWAGFMKGKMGPYMKKYGSHKAAIRQLAKEYKEYKNKQMKKPKVPRNIKRLLDVDSLKRKLRNLRSKRSEYIAHADKEQYRDEIKDLKVRIKTSPQVRHRTTAYDPTSKEDLVHQVGSYGGTGKTFAELRKLTYSQLLKLRNISPRIAGHKQRTLDPSKIPPRWKEAMVKGIKNKSDVRNPWAIVNNIWAKLTPAKKAQIRAREKKGEHFKYDLPLPDDRATKGTGTLRMVKPFNLGEVQVNLSQKDYHDALKSGLFDKMKRQDGTIALVKRCKSEDGNCNIFVDKVN